MSITVVAEAPDAPTEGVNVVSRTLIDDLRAAGHPVRIVRPDRILAALPRLILRPSRLTVFTHGPGPRTVLASRILRLLSRTRLVWVATRPDLGRLPGWLCGRRTAHAVICNRPRADLARAAADARLIGQPIGIAPERLHPAGPARWPALAARGVPIALHVGHLRANRGLERLIELKALLGDAVEIVVVASPRFPPDARLAADLAAAGVHIDRGLVPAIADVYRAADLYLFPTPPEAEGAIELPLSVIEAVACGLPVVSTPFGALPDALQGVDGVTFAALPDFAAAAAAAVSAAPARLPGGLPAHLNAHRLADHVTAMLEAGT